MCELSVCPITCLSKILVRVTSYKQAVDYLSVFYGIMILCGNIIVSSWL